ncbi:MAG: MFS transporter [Bacteroidetes bacterium]|nr:MFS transporter [Bacteroidota bacterium]
MSSNSRIKGFFAGFHRSFWVANTLELFERLAYYAQAAVMSIFLRNHLKFSEVDAGTLSSIFGGFVYLLPIFAGTFADKYGFRKAFSFAFLVMAIGYFAVFAVGSPLYTPFSHVLPLFWVLVFVLIFTAVGESFIKPSVLGTIAVSSRTETRSLGYAIYYMLVNVGGATGPVIAYLFRDKIGIDSVYIVSAVTCALMFLGTLIFYHEPETATAFEQPSLGQKLKDMLRVMRNGRFMAFLLIFSLYWIMFWQVFVIVPFYLTDFISKNAPFEIIESVDAWAIIFLQVIVNRMTKKMPPVTAIVMGFAVSTLSWLVIAFQPNIWTIIAAMVVWSIGEMTQAPRYYEYIADHTPKGQEALFQGYAFLPIAIAWFVGGTFGGWLYSSMTQSILIKTGSTVKVLGQPTGIWLSLTGIGVIATLLMILYNAYITRKDREAAQAQAQ